MIVGPLRAWLIGRQVGRFAVTPPGNWFARRIGYRGPLDRRHIASNVTTLLHMIDALDELRLIFARRARRHRRRAWWA
jgi:hypothetical protein